jgi:hypothetical protein
MRTNPFAVVLLDLMYGAHGAQAGSYHSQTVVGGGGGGASNEEKHFLLHLLTSQAPDPAAQVAKRTPRAGDAPISLSLYAPRTC